MFQVGTWFSYTKPEWEVHLDSLSEYEVKQTGLTREKLKHVLQTLSELKVIK